MGPAEIDQFCRLDDTGKQLMRSAMQQLAITARAFHRILKLGRTIADLAGVENIQAAAPGGGNPVSAAAVRPATAPGVPSIVEVCSNQATTRYQKRISGPLLDRIDIHVEAPRVEYDKLADDRKGEPSAAIRARVEAVRQRKRLARANLACNTALHRYSAPTHRHCAGACVGPAEIDQFCRLDETCQQLMGSAMQQLAITARTFHRILKLGRTIADLAGVEGIQATHLA